MNTVQITRWHNRYRSSSPLPADKLARWNAALAQMDAEFELGIAPEEYVLIRHLALRLGWDAERGELEARSDWQAALQRALQTALSEGGDSVLRYPNRRTALADMLYRAACSDGSRNWAWCQLGWLSSAEASPAQQRLAAVQALLAEPEAIWPVLARLIEAEDSSGALSALLHSLPAEAWLTLLAACPLTEAYLPLLPPLGRLPALLPPLPEKRLLLRLRACCRRNPWLAQRQQAVLALLHIAAAWPLSPPKHAAGQDALLAARVASAWLAVLPEARAAAPARAAARAASGLSFGAGAEAGSALTAQASHDPVRTLAPAESVPVASTAPEAVLDDAPAAISADLPSLPPLPDGAEWCDSQWGGLLLLLNLLPACGLLEPSSEPGVAEPEDIVLQRLWHLATALLGVPPDDPVLRVFCASWRPETAEQPMDAQTLDTALQPIWARLQAWFASELPTIALPALCQRPTRLRIETAWVEAYFPLDSVDTAVRRAALDINPGWLPWLGCVLSFVYE